MTFANLLFLTTLGLPAADHEASNPVYRHLRQTGVAITSTQTIPLPPPSMADGLSAEGQQKVIREVAGRDYAVAELLRKSPVSPHILRLRDITPADPQTPRRGVDVWFIAYGDLKTLSKKEFLERLQNSNREEAKGEQIKSEALKKRGIEIKSEDDKREAYGHLVFNFLDRVQISTTGHTFWSETDDSILIASELDPRFARDSDYPNQWRAISKDRQGKKELGEPQPYQGSGYYLKITRLASPEGALFVEGHVIFAEPVKWFNGANLLRSKLPPVVQNQVRAFRRELGKRAP